MLHLHDTDTHLRAPWRRYRHPSTFHQSLCWDCVNRHMGGGGADLVCCVWCRETHRLLLLCCSGDGDLSSHRSQAAAAAAQAAAAASQINAKLGITGSAQQVVQQMPMGMGGAHSGLGLVTTETLTVPDRMVGLSKCCLVLWLVSPSLIWCL